MRLWTQRMWRADVEFHTMVHSPYAWVWTIFEGLHPPTERSKLPMEAVVLSSARVENNPKKMALRLTTVHTRTCFHLDFGEREGSC